MSEEFSPHPWPPPQPEVRHTFNGWEKLRLAASLATLAVGQAEVFVADNIAEIIVIDAVALPVSLGLALSVPEMRRRIARTNDHIRNFFRSR